MIGMRIKGGLFAAVAVAALTTGAYADVIMTIDLSVADEVTVSATSGLSAVTTSGSDTTGIYFENFFGGAGGAFSSTFVAGDLTNAENPSDGSPALFRAGGGTDPGLNLWSWSSDITVTFTAGSQAFIGSATWTLSPAVYAEMIAGSSSGDIYFPADSEDDLTGAMVLGTYEVIIPAPAAMSLLAIGLGAGVSRRRRR